MRAPGRIWAAFTVLLLTAVPSVSAQTIRELRNMTLEELGNVPVTTVSRSADTQAQAPAAVYVITQDDIRRSGVTSIAAALRLAPGVQVAQRDSTHWAIGIRGFAGPLTRSVLVLIDGRAVYDPLFAGTYWDVQDTLLSDIERIEVVRGPGGTLWGANAINGIINIITKPASDTQGSMLVAQAGSTEFGSAGYRFGGTRNDLSYRVYAQGRHRGPAFYPDGRDDESWLSGRAGFRIDNTLAGGGTVTLQGDIYRASSGQLATLTSYASPFVRVEPYDALLSGGHLRLRWSSPDGSRRPFRIQAYYDRTNREERPVAEGRHTVDVDFQQTLTGLPRHEIIWGLAYRATRGRIDAIAPTVFDPDRRTDQLASAFLEDTIALIPDRLSVSGGARLEHNSYSGFELQPSARVAWTLNTTETFFASVTHAVRTPAPVETDYTNASFSSVNQGLGVFVRLQPNPLFRSEKLTAYEAGYRVQPLGNVYLTVASFFNQLDDMESVELMTPFLETTPLPPHLILPIRFANGLEGSSYGAELTTDVRIAPWWRVTSNYSFLRVSLSEVAGQADLVAEEMGEGSSPRHQWLLRMSLTLPRNVEADWFLRGASALASGPVPRYLTSNARIAWRFSPQFEIALVGENLHRSHHREWAGSAQVPRNAHLSARWTW